MKVCAFDSTKTSICGQIYLTILISISNLKYLLLLWIFQQSSIYFLGDCGFILWEPFCQVCIRRLNSFQGTSSHMLARYPNAYFNYGPFCQHTQVDPTSKYHSFEMCFSQLYTRRYEFPRT